jgi:hypothetical protein
MRVKIFILLAKLLIYVIILHVRARAYLLVELDANVKPSGCEPYRTRNDIDATSVHK